MISIQEHVKCESTKHPILVLFLFSNSGIYSPAWLVCFCRWVMWKTSRLSVPGGQAAFKDCQG